MCQYVKTLDPEKILNRLLMENSDVTKMVNADCEYVIICYIYIALF